MRVNVVVGPSHHGPMLLRALRSHDIDYRAVVQWPGLAIHDSRDGEKRLDWYHWQRRLIWGAWKRLPGLRQLQTPRHLDCLTVDLVARHFFDGGDLLIAWSQVGLRSLVAARERKIPTLLEHPTTHLDTWIRLVEEEYARWPHGEEYSQMPRLLGARMRAEYQAADYISVLSTFAARSLMEHGVPEHKILQLPLGVDEQRFTPAGEPRRGGPLRLLYAGRLELLKGTSLSLASGEGAA